MFLISTFLFLSQAFADTQCVPAREQFSVPHDGQYHRIHPSGEAFMYTDGSQSVIVDVRDRANPKFIKTPMREEAYPVESSDGGWQIIAAPVDGGASGTDGGTDFYNYKELTEGTKTKTKPSYTDKDHGQYYLSAATLPGSTADTKKVRTLLYTDRLYRDYKMSSKADGKITAQKGPKKHLCENIFKEKKIAPEKMRKYEAANAKAYSDYHEEVEKVRSQPAGDERRKAFEQAQEKRDKALYDAEMALYGPEYEKAMKASKEAQSIAAAAKKELVQSPPMIEFEKQLQKIREKQSLAEDKIYSSPRLMEIGKKMETKRNEYYRAQNENRLNKKLTEEYEALDAEYKKALVELQKEAGLNDFVIEGRKVQAAKIQHINSTELGKKSVAADEAQAEADMKIWEAKGGLELANPILSKDGQFVGGMVGSSLNVYKIDASGNCQLAAKTGIRGSKVSFSYAAPGTLPKITFTAEGGGSGKYSRGAYVYDLQSKKNQLISRDTDEAYYPGFTKDGRVMFKSDDDMVIIDPNQLEGPSESCIKTARASEASPKAKKQQGEK